MSDHIANLMAQAAAAQIEEGMVESIEQNFVNSRERAIALARAQEMSMWLARCSYVIEEGA